MEKEDKEYYISIILYQTAIKLMNIKCFFFTCSVPEALKGFIPVFDIIYIDLKEDLKEAVMKGYKKGYK